MAKSQKPAKMSFLGSPGVSPRGPSGSFSTRRIGNLRSATKLQRCGLAEGAKHANRLQPGCTELPDLRKGDYWVSCIIYESFSSQMEFA